MHDPVVRANKDTRGVIGNTAKGALGVYKVGRNTLTLSGDNSYDGNTFVMYGTLLVNHNRALGTAAGNTVIYATGSSAAAYKDDAFFSGTGVLTVLNDHSGTMIKVR